eukprot:1473110-Rhodomonas_salina.2
MKARAKDSIVGRQVGSLPFLEATLGVQSLHFLVFGGHPEWVKLDVLHCGCAMWWVWFEHINVCQPLYPAIIC